MQLKRQLKLAPSAQHPNRQLVAAADVSAESLTGIDATELDAMLLQASDIASNYCDVYGVAGYPPTLARQSVVEQIIIPHEAYTPRVLNLHTRLSPVEVTAITIDGEAVDLADLFIEPVGIISYLPSANKTYWDAGKLIEVTMDAGYVTPIQAALTTPPTGPPLPSDIIRAVTIMAQQINGTEAREEFGLVLDTDVHEDLGTITKRWSDTARTGGMPPEAVAYLGPYRRLL